MVLLVQSKCKCRFIQFELQVVVHPAEEGGFWAEIPAFAGCVSEGETVEETLSNIKEAAEGWLEVASMRPQLL
jgi:predicted RNase H-like HicB family nuclease